MDTLIEFLKGKNRQAKELEEEAQMLLLKKDATGYMSKVRERGTLFRNLGEEVTPYLLSLTQVVQKRVINDIGIWADIAEDGLGREGTPCVARLSTLLYDQHMKVGDPNHLELLIEFLEQQFIAEIS